MLLILAYFRTKYPAISLTRITNTWARGCGPAWQRAASRPLPSGWGFPVAAAEDSGHERVAWRLSEDW
jgi:hypothetical protein